MIIPDTQVNSMEHARTKGAQAHPGSRGLRRMELKMSHLSENLVEGPESEEIGSD